MITTKSSTCASPRLSSSSENAAPKDGEADDKDASLMKKVSVGNLQNLSADAVEMPMVKEPNPNRLSWQVWDEDYPSRRASRKSESSLNGSFYQSIIDEFDVDTDKTSMEKQTSESLEGSFPIKTKRRSMHKYLEEDEEAFANSLRLLALEVEKMDKDASRSTHVNDLPQEETSGDVSKKK